MQACTHVIKLLKPTLCNFNKDVSLSTKSKQKATDTDIILIKLREKKYLSFSNLQEEFVQGLPVA